MTINRQSNFPAYSHAYFSRIATKYADMPLLDAKGSVPLFPFGGILIGAENKTASLGFIDVYMLHDDPRFSTIVLNR